MDYINRITSYGQSLTSQACTKISHECHAFKNALYEVGKEILPGYIYGFALHIIFQPITTLFHELGHKLSAEVLFSNANTEIFLENYGWNGGKLSFNPKNLSILGSQIGYNQSIAIVSAAGPLCDLLSVLMLYNFKSTTTRTITLFKCISILEYAFSAFTTDEKLCISHDFCSLLADGNYIIYGAITASSLLMTNLIFYKIHKNL